MELRQLRCLIAVADTLHFGRAAQSIGMLPASFGRHIKSLEKHVGVPLLVRTTRQVALTTAGEEFVVAAREIVKNVDQLDTAFRKRRSDTKDTLRVGAIDTAAAGLLPQLLPMVRHECSDVHVELVEQKSIHLLPLLLSGQLDIAIVRPPEAWDHALEHRILFHETAVVAVPENHRLSGRSWLSVQEMANEPLIVPDRPSRPHSHDLTMKLFLDAGQTARVGLIAEEKQSTVSLVSTGIGLAIVPRWASLLGIRGVVFIPLQTPSAAVRKGLSLALAWPKDTRHQARDTFIRLLDTSIETLAKSG